MSAVEEACKNAMADFRTEPQDGTYEKMKIEAEFYKEKYNELLERVMQKAKI